MHKYAITVNKIISVRNGCAITFSNQYRASRRTFKTNTVNKQDEKKFPLVTNVDVKKRSILKRRRAVNSDLYIVDDAVAGVVAEHVSQKASKTGYVFEANPGPGILTRALVRNNISRLRVFEKENEFLPALEELAGTYPVLEIIPKDIMSIPGLLSKIIKDCHCRINITEEFFQGIQPQPWKGNIPITFVCVISNFHTVKFLRFILSKFPTMSSVFAFGRCQFFLILSQAEYMVMTAKHKANLSKYRGSTVLYNLFFNIKYIDKFPGNSFEPFSKFSKKSAEPFYFVHLLPKIDVFESVAPADKLPELYYFVTQCMKRRTNRVIPCLENRIDFCGPRLIKKGLDIYTKFGDLSPIELLQVFQQFSSMPQYEDSTFPSEVQEYFHNYRMCETDD